MNSFYFKLNHAAQNDFFKQSPAEQACPVMMGFIPKMMFLF